MFFFHAAPPGYRKLLVVLHDFSPKRNKTLGEYYIRTYAHLIPTDVEIWEYNEVSKEGKKLNHQKTRRSSRPLAPGSLRLSSADGPRGTTCQS